MHKHLIIGPLPPPDGGTTILFQQLIDGLGKCEYIDLIIIDTNKEKNKILKFIKILTGVFCNISKCDSIGFHCSTPLFRYLLPLVYLISSFFRKPLIVRKFGGDYFNFLTRKLSFLDRFVIYCLRNVKLSLFETKREIDVIDNKFNIKNTLWFPNARNKIVGKTQIKNDDSLLMCFLGTVSKEKGVDTLLESLDFLNEPNIHINIYGPCDDYELLLLINNSKFASYKNAYCSDELANILTAHDVLCLPTRYKGEGYPGVIIESYSVGLPVIVSNWQAIPEIVQNEYQGLIFDGSALDLAKCINRVYTKKYLLDFYSKNASSSFDYFDSNKLLEIYKNILVEIKNGI